MRRAEVLRLLDANKERLASEYAVRSLALFGSVVRDEATDSSDIDLLVEFNRPVGLLHVVGTEQYLERLLGVWKSLNRIFPIS